MSAESGAAAGGLPPDLGALVRVSAALGTGDPELLERELAGAVQEARPLEMEEALVQSHLFVGFPGALGALALWRERSGRPAPGPVLDDPVTRAVRGEEVCRRVYGSQYAPLRRNIARLHPDLDRWMVEEGYGKVLGRPGLALERRELCVAAVLAGLGASVQLHSHLRGALRVGVPEAQLQATLDQVAPLLGPERREAMERTWARVRRGPSRSPTTQTED